MAPEALHGGICGSNAREAITLRVCLLPGPPDHICGHLKGFPVKPPAIQASLFFPWWDDQPASKAKEEQAMVVNGNLL